MSHLLVAEDAQSADEQAEEQQEGSRGGDGKFDDRSSGTWFQVETHGFSPARS
jgi:hypothetical protein